MLYYIYKQQRRYLASRLQIKIWSSCKNATFSVKKSKPFVFVENAHNHRSFRRNLWLSTVCKAQLSSSRMCIKNLVLHWQSKQRSSDRAALTVCICIRNKGKLIRPSYIQSVNWQSANQKLTIWPTNIESKIAISIKDLAGNNVLLFMVKNQNIFKITFNIQYFYLKHL